MNDIPTYTCLPVDTKAICDNLTGQQYQLIRLLDVFLLGPAMIYGGTAIIKRTPLTGTFLILSGMGTIFFNGKNFLKIKKLHNAN